MSDKKHREKSKIDRILESKIRQLTNADGKDYYQGETENALEFLKRVLNT